MAKGRTSIGERLKKSRNRHARYEAAHDWADEWERRYRDLIDQLQFAVKIGDAEQAFSLFGDLRGLCEPKFRALHTVIDELTYPSRELEDDGK